MAAYELYELKEPKYKELDPILASAVRKFDDEHCHRLPPLAVSHTAEADKGNPPEPVLENEPDYADRELAGSNFDVCVGLLNNEFEPVPESCKHVLTLDVGNNNQHSRTVTNGV